MNIIEHLKKLYKSENETEIIVRELAHIVNIFLLEDPDIKRKPSYYLYEYSVNKVLNLLAYYYMKNPTILPEYVFDVMRDYYFLPKYLKYGELPKD